MEYVYIVEYWYYDSKDTVSVISVHKTVYGAETNARALINEQIIDDDITPNERVVGFSRDDDGMLKLTLSTSDMKDELESWTVVRTKLEE